MAPLSKGAISAFHDLLLLECLEPVSVATDHHQRREHANRPDRDPVLPGESGTRHRLGSDHGRCGHRHDPDLDRVHRCPEATRQRHRMPAVSKANVAVNEKRERGSLIRENEMAHLACWLVRPGGRRLWAMTARSGYGDSHNGGWRHRRGTTDYRDRGDTAPTTGQVPKRLNSGTPWQTISVQLSRSWSTVTTPARTQYR